MFSRLFYRRLEPNFVPQLFIILLIFFAVVTQTKLAVGLTGLGTVALIVSILVEANRRRVWDDYVASYKKSHYHSRWHEPKRLYYLLNVAVLWPAVALLGLYCLWLAGTI